MRAFWRGLRRFWIVTLGGGVRALILLGVKGADARVSTGTSWIGRCRSRLRDSVRTDRRTSKSTNRPLDWD